ncbi:sugar phosphate isomerase/epimerase family protein [Anaeromassilibacillus senegalensis]|uniref:Sugar phosphate isomerase/epimerase n=1 Tax=Anaeromassilibacillus senegalensis TaxID=1673717 RepID=A0ABS9CP94_9FIRM|nr:sugar phosphate isomerase/epimerase family protein [Anaeromassilibacillus senegalensis]MCF2652859.1 sugar phosphate isomerase/epimerase [Anaeromassilibacillus senegalensis]
MNRMFQSLNLGLANVAEKNFEKKLLLAKKYGFSYIEAGAQEVMENGVENVRALLQKHGMQISSANLPFHPTQLDDDAFASAMEALPAQAAALSAVGCTRCIIWIFPASDTLTKEENYAFHVKRLSAAAAVLKEYGMRLGLEFIGPYTGRKGKKYVFLYTAEEMLKLAKDCGDNVGLLFDAYHWYTGAHNKDVFDHIPDQSCIVSVHVNDAPVGDPLELPDSPRALPGETGMIDIACVINGLRKLGYTGPVIAEPFSPKLAAMETDDEKVACIKACMDKIMA